MGAGVRGVGSYRLMARSAEKPGCGTSSPEITEDAARVLLAWARLI
jgi:hypothetical protein